MAVGFAPAGSRTIVPTVEQLACDARLLLGQIIRNCEVLADLDDEVALRTQVMAECATAMLLRIASGEAA